MSAHKTILAAPRADLGWQQVVADQQTAYAVWFATIDAQEAANLAAGRACDRDSPRPVEPAQASAETLRGMTLAEIAAQSETEDWKVFHRDLAKWRLETEARRASMTAQADAAYDEAYEAWKDALRAVRDYPVASLSALAEKIKVASAHYGDCEVPPKWLVSLLADVQRLDQERAARREAAA